MTKAELQELAEAYNDEQGYEPGDDGYVAPSQLKDDLRADLADAGALGAEADEAPEDDGAEPPEDDESSAPEEPAPEEPAPVLSASEYTLYGEGRPGNTSAKRAGWRQEGSAREKYIQTQPKYS